MEGYWEYLLLLGEGLYYGKYMGSLHIPLEKGMSAAKPEESQNSAPTGTVEEPEHASACNPGLLELLAFS